MYEKGRSGCLTCMTQPSVTPSVTRLKRHTVIEACDVRRWAVRTTDRKARPGGLISIFCLAGPQAITHHLQKSAIIACNNRRYRYSIKYQLKRFGWQKGLSYFSFSIPLPASGSVCISLTLVPLTASPPPDTLGGSLATLIWLLKVFCGTSCCVRLGALPRIADVGRPPEAEVAKVWRPCRCPPFPPAHARPLVRVSSADDDERKETKRPTAGCTETSVGVRGISRGSPSARCAFS